jgi:hypothetical protein
MNLLRSRTHAPVFDVHRAHVTAFGERGPMSLLPTTVHRNERAAHLRLQRLAATSPLLSSSAFAGCVLAAVGCGFDPKPQPGSTARSEVMPTSVWKPPSIAQTSSRTSTAGGAVTRDAATEPLEEDAGDIGTAGAGGAAAQASTDAGKAEARDAAASTPSTPPSSLDAGALPQDAATTPSTTLDAGNPTAANGCKPGAYTGVFNGSVEIIGMLFSNVLGTVSADLTPAASGDYLELHNARAIGLDQTGNSVDVALTGRVSCSTRLLEAGRLEQGTFHYAPTLSDFAFAGTLQGTYSQAPDALGGAWMVEAQDTSLLGGQGTWTLLLSE